MNKPLKITLIVIASVLLAVGVLLLGLRLFFRLPHGDYYDASVEAFEIPGTGDGFVAQGIEYDHKNGHFLVTGYMNDGSASPLYLVSADGELKKTLFLAFSDGAPNDNHCGGIALAGDLLYIAGGGDKCLYLYDYPAVLNAADGATVTSDEATLKTSNGENDYVNASFVTASDEYLIVGEFYREGDYDTPESHHVRLPAGYSHALGVVFRLNSDEPLGVDPTPLAALSLPDQAQGMAITEDRIYISNSWGMSASHIYTFSTEKTKASHIGEISLLGSTLPHYAFSSADLISDAEIPPMAEEMVVVNNRLHVMCESASNKYIFGKFTGGKWCYATELNFFE